MSEILQIENEQQLKSVLDFCYTILGQHTGEIDGYRYTDWLPRIGNQKQVLLYQKDGERIISAVLGRKENNESLIVGMVACDRDYRNQKLV